MSCNKYQPHLLILPEDDANRELANGFITEVASRKIQVLTPARGWSAVRDQLVRDHLAELRKYQFRHMVLLLDFDNNIDQRTETIAEAIPDEVKSRLFLLGVRSEPEALRTALASSYEQIGRKMAQECREDSQQVWAHGLLQHNLPELARLSSAVRAFLFDL